VRAMFIKLEIDWPKHLAAGPCKRCVEVCPVDIFRMADGKLEVVADNEDECILCDMCLVQCPTKAITLRKLY